MPATLSVSIVVHDSSLVQLERSLRCLAASLAHAQASGTLRRATVVVHDNASSAACRADLQTLCERMASPLPEAISLRQQPGERNLGFGAGHNAAQRGSDADWVLILNPDAELAVDAIAAALSWLATQADVVAVNPRSVDAEGREEFLCKRYPTVFDLYLRGFAGGRQRRRHAARLARYEYRDRDRDGTHAVALLSGACLLCRGDAFRTVGGFDPRYFLYFEDFDLSRRLSRHGRLIYLPGMHLVHHGGGAARKGWRHRRWFVLSALRFFRSHGWRLR